MDFLFSCFPSLLGFLLDADSGKGLGFPEQHESRFVTSDFKTKKAESRMRLGMEQVQSMERAG